MSAEDVSRPSEVGGEYDVVVIGGGPAAYTAGIYCGRGALSTLVLEGIGCGGQLATTTDVENYPGFVDPIGGFELVQAMRQQCEKWVADRGRMESDDATDVVFGEAGSSHTVVTKSGKRYTAKAVVIATGANPKTLDLPNGARFWNRGISVCATCDGAAPIFRKKPIVVVGGGDTACEEALFLSRYGSKVYVLVRGDKMRASKVLQQRVKQNAKIEVLYRTQVVDVEGSNGDETKGNDSEGFDTKETDDPNVDPNDVLSAVIVSTPEGTRRIEASGLFYAIGHVPNTDFVRNGGLRLDSGGYVVADSTKTNVPGVFAAGDVQDKVYRQAVTAAASGAMAAKEVEKYLQLGLFS